MAPIQELSSQSTVTFELASPEYFEMASFEEQPETKAVVGTTDSHQEMTIEGSGPSSSLPTAQFPSATESSPITEASLSTVQMAVNMPNQLAPPTPIQPKLSKNQKKNAAKRLAKQNRAVQPMSNQGASNDNQSFQTSLYCGLDLAQFPHHGALGPKSPQMQDPQYYMSQHQGHYAMQAAPDVQHPQSVTNQYPIQSQAAFQMQPNYGFQNGMVYNNQFPQPPTHPNNNEGFSSRHTEYHAQVQAQIASAQRDADSARLMAIVRSMPIRPTADNGPATLVVSSSAPEESYLAFPETGHTTLTIPVAETSTEAQIATAELEIHNARLRAELAAIQRRAIQRGLNPDASAFVPGAIVAITDAVAKRPSDAQTLEEEQQARLDHIAEIEDPRTSPMVVYTKDPETGMTIGIPIFPAPTPSAQVKTEVIAPTSAPVLGTQSPSPKIPTTPELTFGSIIETQSPSPKIPTTPELTFAPVIETQSPSPKIPTTPELSPSGSPSTTASSAFLMPTPRRTYASVASTPTPSPKKK